MRGQRIYWWGVIPMALFFAVGWIVTAPARVWRRLTGSGG